MGFVSDLPARVLPLSSRPDRLKSTDSSTCGAGWQSVQTAAAVAPVDSRVASFNSQHSAERDRGLVRGATAWVVSVMRPEVVALVRAVEAAKGETLVLLAIRAAAVELRTNSQPSSRSAVAVAAVLVALVRQGAIPASAVVVAVERSRSCRRSRFPSAQRVPRRAVFKLVVVVDKETKA